MSIEETYKGMWSSDPSLLKSLLDAGETIIAVHNLGFGRLFVHDCEYVFDVVGYLHYVEFQLAEFLFLVPPRPLVLEPKPLRWSMWDAFSSNLKARDEWRTSEGLLASGKVRYTVESRDARFYWRISNEGDYGSHAHGYCDTQEDAIREIEKWRQDHLEMPVFKCESEPMVEPKLLEWTVDIENTYCAGKDGMYLYMVDSEYGTISIALISHDVKVYESKFSGSLDAGKAAIREWRVNHLKSMLP